MSDVAAPTPPPITDPTPMEAVTEAPPDDIQVSSVSGPLAAPRPVAPRDGTVPGTLVYSDGHCPLLVDDTDIDTRTIVEEHTAQDGSYAGQTVHRYSKKLLTRPTECPTCHKLMEQEGLVATLYGTRDCAIAIQARGNPEYTKLFGLNSAAQAEQEGEAAKHGPFGKRWMKVFGEKPDVHGAPALDQVNVQGQLQDVPRHPITGEPLSENLSDAAKAEIDAARRGDGKPATEEGAVTTAADRKAFELDTLRNARGV
jgi:hypothetical protein